MQNQLLATRIDVEPLGTPRLSYFLSILRFEISKSSANTETEGTEVTVVGNPEIYSRLRRGKCVKITSHSILPYEKETPGLLMAELPLRLKEVSQEEWLLEMQLSSPQK